MLRLHRLLPRHHRGGILIPAKIPFSESTALKLYQEGLTDTQIASEMSLPKGVIRYWRFKNGLIPNFHKIKLHENEILNLYTQGCSDVEISKAVGVKSPAILRWRNLNGLKPNFPKGRKRTGFLVNILDSESLFHNEELVENLVRRA